MKTLVLVFALVLGGLAFAQEATVYSLIPRTDRSALFICQDSYKPMAATVHNRDTREPIKQALIVSCEPR
jgi:hypothetical protein